MDTSAPMTKAQLVLEIGSMWMSAYACKVRFVHACSAEEKQHYADAVDDLEKQHKELWTRLKTGDYMPDEVGM